MPRTQKREIKAPEAPRIPGPLSQAIRAGNLIFVSCGPIDMKGKPVSGSFEKATRRMMENTRKILRAGGSSMERIVRVDAYLQDLDNLDEFNRIYCEYVPEPFPARSMCQPARTPMDLPCAMVVTALAD